MAKVLCVLYADPVDGYPTDYPRDDLPRLERYPDGQTLPTPKAIDFRPGALLGSVSGELGCAISRMHGHTLVVTADKDGAEFGARPRAGRRRHRHLAAVLAGLSDRRTDRPGEEPQDGVTAGIGSDHADLQAAIERGITVAEVTYCNSISVAEHVVMMILVAGPQLSPVAPGGARRRLEHRRLRGALLRRRGHACRHRGGGADRLGGAAAAEAVRHAPPLLRPPSPARPRSRQELGVTWHDSVEDMVAVCDVVTINCPLHPETENLFDAAMIGADEARRLSGQHRARQDRRPRRGRRRARERPARGLCRRRLVPAAGAAGPSVADHAPSRHDAAHFRHLALGPGALRGRHARDPRMLLRGPADPRRISDRQGGHLAGAGAHSYSEGNATGGSEEAARFKG